jgi:hypothetical protein
MVLSDCACEWRRFAPSPFPPCPIPACPIPPDAWPTRESRRHIPPATETPLPGRTTGSVMCSITPSRERRSTVVSAVCGSYFTVPRIQRTIVATSASRLQRATEKRLAPRLDAGWAGTHRSYQVSLKSRPDATPAAPLGLRRRKSGMPSAGLGRAGVRSGAASPKRSAPQNAVHRLRTACAMRCTACGGIRGQDTHPCGAGQMACSTGAMQDAVQVMCAPTLTSRVMVVRRIRCVSCLPGTAAPCPRPARVY